MSNESKGMLKIILGMVLLGLGGLALGAVIGFYATNRYYDMKVLKELKEDKYVITSDATATAEDIIAGKTAYINGEFVTGTLKVLDTSGATAMSSQILQGKTAYVNGELVIGTLPLIQGKEITPSTEIQKIEGGGYLAGDVIIKGDKNFVPGNIKKDIEIFKLTGTYKIQNWTLVLLVDGEIFSTKTYQNNTSIGSLPTPSKEGHSFVGWFYNGQLIEAPFRITEDMTLTAVWAEGGE